MDAKDKGYTLFPDIEKVLMKTDELTTSITMTDDYKHYHECLDILKGEKDLYQKLNDFRLKNMQIQLEKKEHYFELVEVLHQEYRNVLADSRVTDFLTAEQRMCTLMKQIYDCLAKKVELDLSYMQ